MEPNTSAMKIEKLNNEDYHSWKILIEAILTLKDLDDNLYEDKTLVTESLEGAASMAADANLEKWIRKDRKANAFLKMSLTD